MTPIVLTSAQQEARENIRKICATDHRESSRESSRDSSRDSSKVILVQGLSGAGKSALVESMRPELERQGHLILEAEELRSAQTAVNYMNHEGHIVAAAGVYDAFEIGSSLKAIKEPVSYEFYNVNWSNIRKRELHTIDLQGMDADEMRAYAASYVSSIPSASLGLDELIKCSVGLPGLVNELGSIPHLDAKLAQRAAALHLWNNIHRIGNEEQYFTRFLRIQPALEIRAIFDRGFHFHDGSRERHIYDSLPQLRSHYSFREMEEDITFVAQKSIAVYTESLGKHYTGISLHLPRLSADEFAAVAKLMGYTGENYSFVGKSSRWYLFGVDQKELSSYGQLGEIQIGMAQWEPMSTYSLRNSKIQVRTYDRAIETGLIPFPNRPKEGSFMVYVNDHGGVNEQPLNLGWMLESFLQQRNIAYLTHNGMCHKSYVFDGKGLEFLNQGISQKLMELEKEVEKEVPDEWE